MAIDAFLADKPYDTYFLVKMIGMAVIEVARFTNYQEASIVYRRKGGHLIHRPKPFKAVSFPGD